MKNLGSNPLPYALLGQFVGENGLTAAQVIALKVNRVLDQYLAACDGEAWKYRMRADGKASF
jgi:hypothetical protein